MSFYTKVNILGQILLIGSQGSSNLFLFLLLLHFCFRLIKMGKEQTSHFNL